MKTFLPKSLLASLALLTLSLSRADAAIIVTLPTPSTAGSIVITNDISFTITTPGSPEFLVLDEWVANDGSSNLIFGLTPDLSFSLNGGPTTSTPLFLFADNRSSASNAISPNDGYFYFSGVGPYAVNDEFTVKAATYTLPVGLPSNFNPQAAQTFTGLAFLTDGSLARLSGNTPVGAVPEPSRALLLLGGLGALVFRRRRL